jgi:hypothetical protein
MRRRFFFTMITPPSAIVMHRLALYPPHIAPNIAPHIGIDFARS